MIVPIVALNTFKEAVRDKILYVLLVFGVLMIFVSRAIGWVSFGGESKVMTDIGLAAIWMFSGMVSASASFQQFADATWTAAKDLSGDALATSVAYGWKEVDITVGSSSPGTLGVFTS